MPLFIFQVKVKVKVKVKTYRDWETSKENPEIKEWIFKMDWCKKHQVSPANYYFWNKAKEEYIKQEERNERDKVQSVV